MEQQQSRAWTTASPDEEAELWRKYSAASAEGRAALIEHYTPFARMLAAKFYARRHVQEAEFGDFLHYALIGLLEAIDRYDAARGVPFSAFAAMRIQGALLNNLDALNERSAQIALRTRLRKERAASLADEPAAADSFGALFDALASAAVGLAIGIMLEQTGMVARDEFSGQAADNPYSRLEQKQDAELLASIVQLLPPRQAQIVRYHYFFGFAFEEIAREMQLSKGRISQLHREALAALRDLYRQATQLNLRL